MVSSGSEQELLFSSIDGDSPRDMDWLVMTATNPRRLRDRLGSVIVQQRQLGTEDPVVSTVFCPFTYMPSDGTSKQTSKDNYSLRMALRNYVFVQGAEKRFLSLITLWNRMFEDKVFFVQDTMKRPAKIRNGEMLLLISNCKDESYGTSHYVTLEDLDKNVISGQTDIPFLASDQIYPAHEVKVKAGGVVECRIEVKIFNVMLSNFWVTLRNVDTTKWDKDRNKRGHLVSEIQISLLDIFRRKVNGKETDLSRQQDAVRLEDLYGYCDMQLSDGSMKRHFLALMLICAHLLRDTDGVNRFRDAVVHELGQLAQYRESKAATDTRAYLHIAMYIATGDPTYRQMAKDYVRKHDPKSANLKAFVTTICKNQVKPWIGKSRPI